MSEINAEVSNKEHMYRARMGKERPVGPPVTLRSLAK